MILYVQRISIFPRIWTFCSSKVHDFPLNFRDIVHLTNSNFSSYSTICPSNVFNFRLNFNDFVQSTSSIFFHESSLSVHLIYSLNFHDTVLSLNLYFSITSDFLSIQCTQFSNEFSWYPTFNEFNFFLNFGLSVLLMYTISHWIFTILYIPWIRIFPRIWTSCTACVHNFSLNFHDIVYSIDSNFSTNSNILYIYCA